MKTSEKILEEFWPLGGLQPGRFTMVKAMEAYKNQSMSDEIKKIVLDCYTAGYLECPDEITKDSPSALDLAEEYYKQFYAGASLSPSNDNIKEALEYCSNIFDTLLKHGHWLTDADWDLIRIADTKAKQALKED